MLLVPEGSGTGDHEAPTYVVHGAESPKLEFGAISYMLAFNNGARSTLR